MLGSGRADLPLQEHRVLAANNLQWIDGTWETLGNPHNYLNQDGLDFLTISDARVAPWSFTGLPTSRSEAVTLTRDNLQFLILPEDAAWEQFRAAPRTGIVILNLPLAIVRGEVPFLSEARLHNFLDFWKGHFFPVVRAQIHYLASSSATPPVQSRLLYVNRRNVESYSQA